MAGQRGYSRRRILGIGAGGVALAALGGFGAASVSFAQGRARAENEWQNSTPSRLADLGKVKRLSILPLVDWYTSRDDLVGESGLSYLIQADATTILFDVGFNLKQEHPSPLLKNAASLGVDLEDIDALVISHPHSDHIGGKLGSINLSAQPVALSAVPAYLPTELASPASENIVVDGPRKIAPGIASLGVIGRQDFFSGWTPEQSLAIDVEGRGVVLVVGCGHPTIERIVERSTQLLDAPVYGIVGGLHFPVTASRASIFGVPAQKIMGTGKWPWDPIGEAEVDAAIDFLERQNLGLVALSAHDSCDWSIGKFRQAFGTAAVDVKVGQKIVVA